MLGDAVSDSRASNCEPNLAPPTTLAVIGSGHTSMEETMHTQVPPLLNRFVAAAAVALLTFGFDTASARHEDEGPLQRALERFVAQEGGPPGIAVVVARGKLIDLHTAGVANLKPQRPIR